MIKFNHFNFNVFDLQKSLDFYQEALNLTAVREKNASDGSFKLVYLGDGESDFTIVRSHTISEFGNIILHL